MKIILGSSANDVWMKAYHELYSSSGTQNSRLGETKELLHANLNITDPRQRWILSRLPAMNPAFAIAEVFWILSGDNNANLLNYFNPILPKFAGQGDYYYGAYGERIRKHYGIDQLYRAYMALLNNPDSRQVVIQIWSPEKDLPLEDGRPRNVDIPCNICSMPKVRNGKLEWLQVMRSNDIFLGVPHNVVQFSTLQEIMAGWLSLELGSYHHISDSLHIYKSDDFEVTCDNDLTMELNTDDLRLPYKEFEDVLQYITKKLYSLTTKSLKQQDFSRIIEAKYLPLEYKNLLLIAAADSARRRKWYDLMEQATDLCTNNVILIAWQRWLSRKSK